MFHCEAIAVSLLAMAGASSAHYISRYVPSNVTIVAQGKNFNTTGGEGHVAAGGILNPFGSIGVGCGVNWHDGVGYGGGLDAGSKDFGLGGGYRIENETISIGAGIGINPSNSSADFNLIGSTNGTFELSFRSSKDFTCVNSNFGNGTYAVVCKTS